MNAESIFPEQDSVVQTYILHPYLINGFKFDLRIYALVISCDPLRVYIYNEGLVRICTTPYCEPNFSNLHIPFMHLTNYSINKENPTFRQNNSGTTAEDDCDAKKQSLAWLWSYLVNQGHNKDQIWTAISDIIVKTLISIQPSLAHTYNKCKSTDQDKTPFTCFEILGFDIIMTRDLVPILLEVNHTPSFRTDRFNLLYYLYLIPYINLLLIGF